MSDESDRIAQLEKKVETLEEELEDSGVSRRDVLAGAGGGALAGLLGVGSLASSTKQASASTAPNYGTPSNPADFYAVDLFGPNGGVNLQNDINGNGQAINNLGSLSTDELFSDDLAPGVFVASNNHSQLPDVSTAIANSTDGDTIHIVPGRHDISSTITRSTGGRKIVFHGYLYPTGDFTAIEFGADRIVPGGYQEGAVPMIVDASNCTTTPGVTFRKRAFSTGILGVRYGAPSFLLEDNDSNLNHSQLNLFSYQPTNGGVVIREASDTSAEDTNAMPMNIEVIAGSGTGLDIQNGYENEISVAIENMDKGIHLSDRADGNDIHIRSIESITNNEITVDSLSANNNFTGLYNLQDGSVVDNGAKTMAYGVAGGGPFSLVDLTAAGSYDGQQALSDGTATGFPAHTLATWDATNTQWVRADGQATV